MFRVTILVFAAGMMLTTAFAQQPSMPARSQAMPAAEAQKLIAEQFGPSFKLLDKFPVLAGDLDSDDAEDLLLVATGKSPLLDETDFHYKTIDPYSTFFGFGDPQVTMRFAVQDGTPRYLLIVHGWRETTPKAKFVAINLPFEKLELARVRVKKKTLPGISLEDHSGQTSDLYWTGKQWKWADSTLKSE
jgi:hypothetical protein